MTRLAALLRAPLGAAGRRLGPRADAWLALGLAVVTLASRWPYRARMLYNWDAVQFALALREFDIAKHQPHPPGYVLYVLLGRLVNAWLGDPTLAYVGLAMLFSAATTFVVYAPQSAISMMLTAGDHIALPAGVKRLVWFVDHWDPALPRPPRLLEIELPHGRYLYVLPIGRAPAEYAGYTFVRDNG